MPFDCAYLLLSAISSARVGRVPSTTVQVSTPSVMECSANDVPSSPMVCRTYAR